MYFSELKKTYKALLCLLLIVLFLSVSSCDNKEEGLALAESGIASCEKIAEYFDALASDSEANLQEEIFFSVKQGLDFNPRARDQYLFTASELRKRGQMMRNAAKSYRTLKELSGYNSDSVKNSVESLASSIISLKMIPNESKKVDPSTIFGMIAQDLINWKQASDIRQSNKLILSTLTKIRNLMANEKEIYEFVENRRLGSINNVINILIKEERVSSLNLLQNTVDVTKLKLDSPDKPLKCLNDKSKADEVCQNTKKALIQMAQSQFEIKKIKMSEAGNAGMSVLDELIGAHIDFANKQKLNFKTLIATVERLQNYLDEVKKLKEPITEEK